ncbi:hypothetical protein MtrunA17_Chr8g0386621 [Medicago truncatula]|uniref:Uncharacterized protein n=1 Tax=Medicago truncatula TaxID=3880 RepID=A0A396GQK7_MEDTR|nr:hypothetical protein MtrunA17_Chr8g0386621 [Medicago truncatula]
MFTKVIFCREQTLEITPLPHIHTNPLCSNSKPLCSKNIYHLGTVSKTTHLQHTQFRASLKKHEVFVRAFGDSLKTLS